MMQKGYFLAVGALVVALSAGYTGYQLGQTAATDTIATMTREYHSPATQKYHSQADIDALAAHIGLLQAKLLRLEALGQHLAQAAEVDMTEFDFNQVPAQGGLASVASLTDLTAVDVQTGLSQLATQLENRSQQLILLQDLWVQHSLEAALIPESPVQSGWISSPFGERIDPITGKRELHKGIDFAGQSGSPIHAVAAGVVVSSGDQGSYGNLIEIQHDDGYITRYAHNQKNLVQPGDRVKKGDLIALMGSTGRSTGYHLHLEVVYQGEAINPARYMTQLSLHRP